MIPKISILMPVYNEEKYVSEAINSVLNQSYKDVELIVVNDGSTDKTWDIISEYSKKDARVRVFNPGKVGKNEAINIAYKYSQTNLFYILAGDDILLPHTIEVVMSHFEKYDPETQKIAIFGKLKVISEQKLYNGLILPKNPKKGSHSGGTLAFTKALSEEIFPIPNIFPNEDGWAILCVDYFAEKVIDSGEIFLLYRIHENNSMKRNVSFDIINNLVHQRRLVFKHFLKEKGKYLSNEEQDYLTKQALLEDYRYKKKIFRILIMRGVGFKNKMRALFYSNKIMWWIKKKLDRFFLGH